MSVREAPARPVQPLDTLRANGDSERGYSAFQSLLTTFRITPVSVVKPQWLSLV